MLTITAVHALKDNYIWIISDSQSQAVHVVDPGDALPVIDFLKTHQLTLKSILLTHHHPDHSGGISHLLNYAENVSVYGSDKSSVKYITHSVKNNDEIILPHVTFKAFAIPGHTLDHTAFYAPGILFSGDTLFSMGCGRVFEGTPAQMYASLQTLSQLPDTTRLYCGHEYTLSNLQFAQHVEPENFLITERIALVKKQLQDQKNSLPSLLKDEKKLNPFLRCHTIEIMTAASSYAGKSLSDPTEVFAYLRKWKNSF